MTKKEIIMILTVTGIAAIGLLAFSTAIALSIAMVKTNLQLGGM